MPKPWLVWLAVLVLANAVGPIVFIGTTEGKVVLGALVVGAIIQTSIFQTKGFVRLLGLGHVLWLGMVPWLWTRLDQAAPGSVFRSWILIVVVIDIMSLLIDITDVARYVRGEREPV